MEKTKISVYRNHLYSVRKTSNIFGTYYIGEVFINADDLATTPNDVYNLLTPRFHEEFSFERNENFDFSNQFTQRAKYRLVWDTSHSDAYDDRLNNGSVSLAVTRMLAKCVDIIDVIEDHNVYNSKLPDRVYVYNKNNINFNQWISLGKNQSGRNLYFSRVKSHVDSTPLIQFLVVANNGRVDFFPAYYATDLISVRNSYPNSGLALQGGVPEWDVDPNQYTQVINYIHNLYK